MFVVPSKGATEDIVHYSGFVLFGSFAWFWVFALPQISSTGQDLLFLALDEGPAFAVLLVDVDLLPLVFVVAEELAVAFALPFALLAAVVAVVAAAAGTSSSEISTFNPASGF